MRGGRGAGGGIDGEGSGEWGAWFGLSNDCSSNCRVLNGWRGEEVD